ncbi:MAG: hypothetical protein HYW22_01745 [Candidatus Aenigmarchaeota archaeon]|nr:hypothetical protein [Candidatus Aenigmarchaeota archaeon]
MNWKVPIYIHPYFFRAIDGLISQSRNPTKLEGLYGLFQTHILDGESSISDFSQVLDTYLACYAEGDIDFVHETCVELALKKIIYQR